jgi:hypothetical protein
MKIWIQYVASDDWILVGRVQDSSSDNRQGSGMALCQLRLGLLDVDSHMSRYKLSSVVQRSNSVVNQ